MTFFVCLCFLFVSSRPARPAEVALQHQPAAAEPPPADEGGRRRGRQGQRATPLHRAHCTVLIVFVLMTSRKKSGHIKN